MDILIAGIALGILFNEAWRRGIFKLDSILRTRRSS